MVEADSALALAAITGIFWIIFLIGGLIVLIVWLLSMQKAIDQCSHDVRKMEPGAVWLCMIPLFGLVWQYLVVGAVSHSIAEEFRYRNFLPEEPRPGYSAGLTGSILISCIIIPYAGPAFGLVGLIFMLIHLTRINKYNRILEQSGRWEIFYQQRMAAMKQQQSTGWQQMQTSYGQSPVPPRNTPLPGDEVKKNPFG